MLPLARIAAFVIFERPDDHPTDYVVRQQFVTGDGIVVAEDAFAICRNLEDARRAIPKGTINIGRHPKDHASITEVWM